MRVFAVLGFFVLVGCNELKQMIASGQRPTDEEVASMCGVSASAYKELEARARTAAIGTATQLGSCSARKGDDGRVYIVAIKVPETR